MSKIIYFFVLKRFKKVYVTYNYTIYVNYEAEIEAGTGTHISQVAGISQVSAKTTRISRGTTQFSQAPAGQHRSQISGTT